MSIVRRTAMGVLCGALAGSLAMAQAPAGPPKPGPEHQKLARFVGTWNGKAEMKSGPYGPGGPMTWTEVCDWFEGGFSLVCRSDGKGPMGAIKSLGIVGYNPEEKAYTHYGVDSMGWSSLSKGSVSGKVWTYTSKSTMGGKPNHERFSITEVSDTRQSFKWEVSPDGKTWTVMMEVESTR